MGARATSISDHGVSGPTQSRIPCWSQSYKKSVGEARQRQGRTVQTRFCLMDSQSVKHTDTAAQQG